MGNRNCLTCASLGRILQTPIRLLEVAVGLVVNVLKHADPTESFARACIGEEFMPKQVSSRSCESLDVAICKVELSGYAA